MYGPVLSLSVGSIPGLTPVRPQSVVRNVRIDQRTLSSGYVGQSLSLLWKLVSLLMNDIVASIPRAAR